MTKYIVPELLDGIKAKYEDDLDKPTSIYMLVLQFGDNGFSTLFKKELVAEYEDLCVRLFDLDVSGWEVSEQISGEAQKSNIGTIYNVVTIRMVRSI